jgi:hypothetical protein
MSNGIRIGHAELDHIPRVVQCRPSGADVGDYGRVRWRFYGLLPNSVGATLFIYFHAIGRGSRSARTLTTKSTGRNSSTVCFRRRFDLGLTRRWIVAVFCMNLGRMMAALAVPIFLLSASSSKSTEAPGCCLIHGFAHHFQKTCTELSFPTISHQVISQFCPC